MSQKDLKDKEGTKIFIEVEKAEVTYMLGSTIQAFHDVSLQKSYWDKPEIKMDVKMQSHKKSFFEGLNVLENLLKKLSKINEEHKIIMNPYITCNKGMFCPVCDKMKKLYNIQRVSTNFFNGG